MPELESDIRPPDLPKGDRPDRFLGRLKKKSFKKLIPAVSIGSLLAASILSAPDQSQAQARYRTYLPYSPRESVIEKYTWDTTLTNRSVVSFKGDKVNDGCFFNIPLGTSNFSTLSGPNRKLREIEFNQSECITTFEQGLENPTPSSTIPVDAINPAARRANNLKREASQVTVVRNYQVGVEFGVKWYDPLKLVVSEVHPFMGVDLGDNQLTDCGANIWRRWLVGTGWTEAVADIDPPYYPDNKHCEQFGHIVHNNPVFQLPHRACQPNVTVVYDLGINIDEQGDVTPSYKYFKYGRSCQVLLKSEIIPPFKQIVEKPK